MVLGGSGFVGKHLLARLAPGRYSATFSAHPVPGAVKFDCTAMRLSAAVGDLSQYDQALLLLGDTEPNSCARDPERSRAVNVDGIKTLIDDLVAAGVRPIFISSEFVFDGRKGQYLETDPPTPILLYGQQKLEIERYLESATQDFAVLRLAKIYGGEVGDGTLFTNWLPVIESGGRMKCASDQIFSPIHVDDVVDALLLAAASKIRGIFHVGGPQGLSRMQCLQALLTQSRRLRAVDLQAEPCRINDFDFPETRPVDVSMRIDKFSAEVDFSPIRVEDFCRHLAEREFRSGASA